MLTLKSPTQEEADRIKCVFVGDAGVGKTSLIVSYTTNGYPHEYLPTAFDNYSVLVRVDNKPHRLQLCDTAGQDEFKSLRMLCYPDSDVFLLCFSVVCPSSFYSLHQVWMPEIRAVAPSARVILIGTQSDLRSNVGVMLELSRYGERPVAETEARDFAAEIQAEQYLECSALTQRNLKEVFDAAILVGLKSEAGKDEAEHHVFVQEVKGGVAVKGIQALRDRLKRTNSLTERERLGLKQRRPPVPQPPTPLSPGLPRKALPIQYQPTPQHQHRNIWGAGGRGSGYQSDTGSAVMLRRQLSNTRLNEVRAPPPPPAHRLLLSHPLPPTPPAGTPKFSKLKKGWKAFMCLF